MAQKTLEIYVDIDRIWFSPKVLYLFQFSKEGFVSWQTYRKPCVQLYKFSQSDESLPDQVSAFRVHRMVSEQTVHSRQRR